MGLQGQVARGLAWEGMAAVAARAISFLATMVLARVLAPDQFGLLAIAVLAMDSLYFFQELGFGNALIYRQSDVDKAADTAFVTLIGTSLLLYGVAVVVAPLVASFFGNADVTPVLRVLAVTMVINAVGRVPLVLLLKDMDFRRKVFPEIVAGIVGNSVAVVLALRGNGVWSLVWGQIVDASVRTALVWWVSPWRPHLRFDRAMGRELFGYGKHIAGSQLLIFGITNIDDAFVGRLLGDAPLGHYGMAYKISNFPATNITRLITRVTFPAFSKLQGDWPRMRSAYYRITRLVALVAFPVGVATVFFAADFVHTVIGDKWAPAILPMQLLGIYGILRSVAVNMGTIFQAGGKPQWLFSIALWRLATMALLLYPAIRWQGIVGVSALSAAVSVVDFVISALLVSRIIGGSAWDYPRLLGPVFVAALVAGGVGKAAQYGLLTVGGAPLVALLAGGAVLVLVYAALVWWRDGEVRAQAAMLWQAVAGRRWLRFRNRWV